SDEAPPRSVRASVPREVTTDQDQTIDMRMLARWARTFGLTRAICILLLLALIPLRIVDPPPLEEIRLRTFDFYQSLRPRQTVARPVTIVDIDERSLKEIGQWPWPRTIVADLVTQLSQLGAVAIAFDVIFAEPDRMSPSIAAASFRNLDDDTRNKLRSLPSNDEVLAEAIQRSRVVVGQVGSATPVPRSETEAALPTGFAVKGPDPSSFLVTFAGLLRNVPAIEQAGAGRLFDPAGARRDCPPRAYHHAGTGRDGAVSLDGTAARRGRLWSNPRAHR